MEDFEIDIMLGKGPTARSMKIGLKKFTLIGATTRAGLLTPPLRARFGDVCRFDFYTPTELELIVKRAAQRVGLDPATFAGHSLRAGFATSAARADVSERGIMEQGRWRSLTVARGYIRDGSIFRDNPAAKIGL